MSSNDFEVVAYKILTYAYECVKAGAVPSWAKAEEFAGCNPLMFRTVAHSLADDGYIGKVLVGNGDDGAFVGPLRITFRGVEFLEENSSMSRVKTFLGAAFKAVLEAAIQSTLALGKTGV